MEHEEKQESSVEPLPVIPRLDRLNRLLQLLEEKEKHHTSDRHLPSPVVTKTQQQDDDDDGQCKALFSALKEVHHKGTLMERLSILENRVLQSSLEMFERNTSTALVSEIISVVPKVSSSQHEGENEVAALQIQEEAEACNLIKPKRRESGSGTRREKRKWIGWFGIMGC